MVGSNLLCAAAICATIFVACGSSASRPTLPPPEFEPPVLPEWDGGVSSIATPSALPETPPPVPSVAPSGEPEITVPIAQDAGASDPLTSQPP
jgi:hypothetical protein